MVMQKLRPLSFYKSSLFSQFNILFVLISIIPLSILYYLYIDLRGTGQVQITKESLEITLACVVLGIGLGYFLMRLAVQRILKLAKTNEQALRDILGPERVPGPPQDSNEMTALARTFEEVIFRLENNIKKLELAKGTLQNVLVRIGQGISSFQHIDNFLDLIIETITGAVGGKVGILLLLDDTKNHLEIKAIYGVLPDPVKKNLLDPAGSTFKKVILEKQDLLFLNDSKDSSSRQGRGRGAAFMATPLLFHREAFGAVVIYGRNVDIDFSDEEMSLLRSVAVQTAVAIENDRLNIDAEKNYFSIISALALAVEAKDLYSRGHQDRVAEYAVKIAEKLKLSEEEKNTLRDAGKLHDLGKIGVSDEILSKPGPLTEEEWGVMRTHPSVGEEILKPVKTLDHLRDLVRHHHEKLDGSGYPDGLKGDQISLLARILSVADIYDALRTNRPYRKALSKPEAAILLEAMTSKVDQKIVAALLAAV